MASEYTATARTWSICHNNDDVLHISILEEGDFLETGQPELEVFDNEEDLKDRVEEISGDPDYYEDWKAENE